MPQSMVGHVVDRLRIPECRDAGIHLPRPLSFNESWEFIEALRALSSFGIMMETDRHPEIVRELAREYPEMSGTRFHDLHLAAVMREHGITEIRTADADFHQFKFLRVTNPFHAGSRR